MKMLNGRAFFFSTRPKEKYDAHQYYSDIFLFKQTKTLTGLHCRSLRTCLVYAVGVENYTFEAQTTHLRLHYTNYANDFVSAMR